MKAFFIVHLHAGQNDLLYKQLPQLQQFLHFGILSRRGLRHRIDHPLNLRVLEIEGCPVHGHGDIGIGNLRFDLLVVHTQDDVQHIVLAPDGAVQDGSLTVFGKVEPKPCSVVIADNKEETAYYVVGTSETTVKSTVEGVEYEREGTAIALDEKVEEVRVVKAGKRYFIYKGPDKAE